MLFRSRRVPYVLLGTLLFCSLALLAVPLIFRVGAVLQEGAALERGLAMAALCGLFALYGLAVSLASTPYLALVIDRTSEAERPRVVGIIWCMLTVGIVIGAIAIQISLRSLDGVRDPGLLREALQLFMLRVAAVVMLLTLVATWGMERRRPRATANPAATATTAPPASAISTTPTSTASTSSAAAPAPAAPPPPEREDRIGLRQSWLLITSSRQVGVF